ncbi:MAG: Cof subfamily protein (haloacid dehalogenase superfamily)/pseudouridine synthase [Saprospiraceae bacterium]|jgi:Cof subfamily protein (haloacid dehalogenase superfamily)/pseudouridine synthase
MLSQFINSKKRKKTVLGELHDFPAKTMAIGRLDVDSEGLLLLTTNGKVSSLITGRKVEKEYYVQVDGEIDEAAVERLKTGVEITVKGRPERYLTLPCNAFRLPEPPNFPPRTKPIRGHHHGPTSWVSITLKEGKNRQIRKMTAAVGFPTLRLFRVRIGDVKLGEMQAGKVIETPFFDIDFGKESMNNDLDLKIAFTDIDGTLLNKEREISENLKKAVDNISNKNIPFILISSRMPNAMRHLQNNLNINDLPLICYNGGLVLLDGKSIHSTEISVEAIETIAGLNADKKFHISLYNHDDWYVESMDFWAKREQHNTKVTPTVQPIEMVLKEWKTAKKGAHKIMCMGDKEELDKVVAVLKEHFSDSLHLYRSKDTYLEIANKEISKLTGIQVLLAAKYPDLSLDNCIAFGDNYNDIEMLEAVKIGVAVQNAKAEVLESVDVVTDSNHEDGVAKAISLYF